MRKHLSLVVVVLLLAMVSFLSVQRASAASLTNATATLTTSRPSPSSPLSANTSAGATGVTVLDNTSTFLSSDSAKIYNGATFSENINVATTSANKLTVNFSTPTTAAHSLASVIFTPITAMHTYTFTVSSAVPTGGKIIIQYPTSNSFSGADVNQASPSANTWMFNGLNSSTDIQMKPSSGTATCSWAVSGVTNGSNGQTPTITCTVGTASITTGTTIKIFVGCTAATYASGCSAQKPLLINPTNSNARGVATVRNVTITTQDSGSNPLDTSSLRIGNVESVFVVAHVDPTFTFKIEGVPGGTDLQTVCSGYTSSTYLTNSSFDSTPTEVNMGTISNSSANYAAQKMTITSNTASGYSITATTSGYLVNPATGIYIPNAQGTVTANDTPSPALMPAAGGYGISACDSGGRVATGTWGTTAPKFANPAPNYYYTLVNYSGALPSGDTIYSVYGAKALSNTPPGDYWQIITYTASVTF